MRFSQPHSYRFRFALLMILGALSAPASSALIKADSGLVDAPSARAAEIGSVVAGDEVTFKQRKGLWAEVCKETLCGWLRITKVELKNRAGATKTNLATLKSGRAGAGNAVSSTGVRGLDAESIDVGNPDYEALAMLEAYRVTTSEVDAFVRQGMLENRNLAMLDSPAEAAPGSRDSRSVAPRGGAVAKPKKQKDKRKEASDDDW